MKLVDRYVVRNFLVPLALALFFLVFMIHIIDIFDRIDFFSNTKAPLYRILLYYLFKSPYLMVQMLPVATLFATVFSLAEMSRNKETIAVLTTGVSFYRLIKPLIITSFVLFVVTILFNDYVVPAAADASKNVMERITSNKRTTDNYRIQKYGKENMVYFIDVFQSHVHSYHGLVALKRDANNDIILRIDSPHGVWDKETKQWKMMPVTMRYFSNNMVVRTVTYRTQLVYLSEGPQYFSKEAKKIEDMPIRESWEYIRRVQSGGFGAGKELVEFNWKFAFPFGCVMMVLIGGPLSAFSRRNILITSFLLAFLGTLVYYVILYFCYTLGKNEVLNPFLAAWMGNFIFAGLSAYLLKKTST